MLMVLMGMMPGLYAIDPVKDQASYQNSIHVIEDLEAVANTLKPNKVIAPHARQILDELVYLKDIATREFDKQPLTEDEKVKFRANILDVHTSGVAGSVVSSGDRLQWSTLRAIVITWFTTLPGTMLLSFAMGVVLHTALV